MGAVRIRKDPSKTIADNYKPSARPHRAVAIEQKREEIAKLNEPASEEELLLEAFTRVLNRGASDTMVVQWARATYGFGENRSRTILAKVRGKLIVDFETRKNAARAEMSERLRNTLVLMREPHKNENGNARPLPWQSIARVEELLADVEGTREPQKVELDVRVQTALMKVVTNLSPERMEELRAKARARLASGKASEPVQ